MPNVRPLIFALPVLLVSVLVLATACSGGSSTPTPSGTTAPSGSTSTTASPSASDWRETQYAKIGRLRGGSTLDYFRDLLGTPMFVTRSRDGRFTQSLFQEPDYWVQAITDAFGTVELMAVSSCDLDFRPRFNGVSGATPSLGTIVLNETHLDQVGAEPSKLHYFVSGATANTYLYDEYSFGNPGYYKTYFVGIDDACPSEPANAITDGLALTRDQAFDPNDDLVRTFRARAIANTYGETGPNPDQDAVTAFQIGADRILTRTAPPFPRSAADKGS